jgi:putative redox protein
MRVSANWIEGLQFEGHGEHNPIVPLNSKNSPENFSPMELLALGLAGCTGMDVISILQKKRQDVRGLEVVVTGTRAREYPKIFSHFDIEYVVTGKGISQIAVDRAVTLSAETYCPAAAMLGKSATMKHITKIIEVDA